jgi:hypothetical protein
MITPKFRVAGWGWAGVAIRSTHLSFHHSLRLYRQPAAAVRIDRSFNAAAMPRNDVTSDCWISAIVGAKSAARMNSTARETWQWTQIGERAPTHGPNGGNADSLDEAKAAFRQAWERAGQTKGQ